MYIGRDKIRRNHNDDGSVREGGEKGGGAGERERERGVAMMRLGVGVVKRANSRGCRNYYGLYKRNGTSSQRELVTD